MLDERISLTIGVKITSYNDRYYKIDYTIYLYEDVIFIWGNEYDDAFIYSTTGGDTFIFEIVEGNYEKKMT